MEKRKIKGYRKCFVPKCGNNTNNQPNKVFVSVPKSSAGTWFKLVNNNKKRSIKTNHFCCEDHFDLKEDLENYVKFSLMGGPLKIKPGVVPHKFECQSQLIENSSRISIKRKRKADGKEILHNCDLINSDDSDVKDVEIFSNSKILTKHSNKLNINNAKMFSSNKILDESKPKEKGVQVNIGPHVRSKGVNCKIQIRDASTSPFEDKKNEKSSELKINHYLQQASDLCSISSCDSSCDSSSSFRLSPTKSESSVSSIFSKEEDAENKVNYRKQCLELTNFYIDSNPKQYIGIDSDWAWIIAELHRKLYVPKYDIKLVLMKIKLNDSFERLGDQFNISVPTVSRIFSSTVVKLENMLKTLIFFPKPNQILELLPIPFRANYSHVVSIIDAFEIQIEKPTCPLKQAATWSEYKKCNTLKYLISSTPDGFINFVSNGYGGRISDTKLTEQSGFLNLLPMGCCVMADRGFKQIETLLNKKNCSLVRPPSVLSDKTPSKEQTIEAKKIASLRIHIERVIRRLREFHMLKPHSCLPLHMMPHIDYIVKIACALINLQSPIIRQH